MPPIFEKRRAVPYPWGLHPHTLPTYAPYNPQCIIIPTTPFARTHTYMKKTSFFFPLWHDIRIMTTEIKNPSHYGKENQFQPPR